LVARGAQKRPYRIATNLGVRKDGILSIIADGPMRIREAAELYVSRIVSSPRSGAAFIN
jgi:hypothetical protein